MTFSDGFLSLQFTMPSISIHVHSIGVYIQVELIIGDYTLVLNNLGKIAIEKHLLLLSNWISNCNRFENYSSIINWCRFFQAIKPLVFMDMLPNMVWYIIIEILKRTLKRLKTIKPSCFVYNRVIQTSKKKRLNFHKLYKK